LGRNGTRFRLELIGPNQVPDTCLRDRGPIGVCAGVRFPSVGGLLRADRGVANSAREIAWNGPSDRALSRRGRSWPPEPASPDAAGRRFPCAGLCGRAAGLLEQGLAVGLRGLHSLMVELRFSSLLPTDVPDHLAISRPAFLKIRSNDGAGDFEIPYHRALEEPKYKYPCSHSKQMTRSRSWSPRRM
jgi:hypothetical protein